MTATVGILFVKNHTWTHNTWFFWNGNPVSSTQTQSLYLLELDTLESGLNVGCYD